MKLPGRRVWIGAAVVVAVVGAVVAWIMLPPRALGFAGGPTVALADYKGANPTGAPPAYGWPPGAVWQTTQSAASARYLPRATTSAVASSGGAPVGFAPL